MTVMSVSASILKDEVVGVEAMLGSTRQEKAVRGGKETRGRGMWTVQAG